MLAIETHFEFTTAELLRLFEDCGAQPGGCIGLCLDTMNLLTMLEEPVAATRRALPWVVAVHAKDGALLPHAEGLMSFPTALGAGQVNFARILPLLAELEHEVRLSIEAHGGNFVLPIHDRAFLARFPDLAPDELADLVRLSEEHARTLTAGGSQSGMAGLWGKYVKMASRSSLSSPFSNGTILTPSTC